MGGPIRDLTGQRLTVPARAPNTKDCKARWVCECGCPTGKQ
jgi:hypothetical protein